MCNARPASRKSDTVDTSPGYTASIEGRFCLVRIPGPVGGVQPRRIELAPRPSTKMPAGYQDLFAAIMRTLTVLNMLFPQQTGRRLPWQRRDRSEQRFREYFDKLGGLALAALGQDQVPLGIVGLKQIQDEVVERESSRVKNGYMRVLGRWALLFMAVSGSGYLICRAHDPQTILHRYGYIASMITGSFLGTWLSFGVRRVRLQFFDLTRLEDDLFDPPVRLIFVAAMTLVIGLMLRTGAIKLTAGGIDTAALQNAGADAFLIGCFCGLCEKALPSALSHRTTQFIGLIAGAGRDGTEPSPESGAAHTASAKRA
jgi:hypothetical protein